MERPLAEICHYLGEYSLKYGRRLFPGSRILAGTISWVVMRKKWEVARNGMGNRRGADRASA